MFWRDAFFARASGLASGRVYWADRPQDSRLPALMMFSVDDGRPQTLKDWDLAPARIQIDAYGRNQEEVWSLAEAALDALVPGTTSNGHKFSRADVVLGPRDLPERVGNTTVFRVSMDLIVHHAETEEAS